MTKRKKEALLTGAFILILIFGDIYARDTMNLIMLIGVVSLFVIFFIFVYDKE